MKNMSKAGECLVLGCAMIWGTSVRQWDERGYLRFRGSYWASDGMRGIEECKHVDRIGTRAIS